MNNKKQSQLTHAGPLLLLLLLLPLLRHLG